MKLKTILCAVFAATLLGSCNYDDGELWDAVNGQEERISALEKWQKTVNEQLNSLQGILTAADYVTEVTSVEKDGKKGYKISFLHADPITLYYNENNEVSGSGDNAIGVDKDDTGWFWTMGGKPLEIETGKKVYVTGETITATYNPDSNSYTIKIGNQTLEVAEAPVVHPIKGVTTEGNIVTVELADGNKIKLAKYIDLGQYLEGLYNGQSEVVEYPIPHPDGYVIKVLDELPEGWSINISRTETGTNMSVTYPATGRITVTFLISNGSTQTIMKEVVFDAGKKADIVWTTVEYTGTALTAKDLGGAKNIRVTGDTGSGSAPALNNILAVLKNPANGVVNIDLSGVIHNVALPSNAFNYSEGGNAIIETIILPKTLSDIWGNAFANCTALKSVTIVTNREISSNNTATWFTNCNSLESIFVPADKVETYKTNWGAKDASLISKIKPISAE